MKNDDDRIDFSSLDPSRDSDRWNQVIASVAARGRRAHQRKHSLQFQLAAWAGPVLAAAAALALVSWAGALGRGSSEDASATVEEPAYVLSSWAANHAQPQPDEILGVLGDGHGNNR